MFERGMFSQAEPLLTLAQGACPEEFDPLTRATLLFNLAGIRFECNRVHESLDLCKRALDLRSQHLAADDPVLGNTYFSLGIIYMESGDLRESLSHNLKALEIQESSQRHDGSPVAWAQANLGLCYWKMRKLELASEWLGKAQQCFGMENKWSQKYGQYDLHFNK